MTDLVKRAKKGDKEAFILLMDHHRQMLYNTALLVLHREDDALDAIQDTILACWENLPSLQKDRYFKTWLVRILLNKCADIQRGQSHYAFVEELPESAEEPDWDTRVDVRRAMAKLGDQDQLILSLFYYDDFSVRRWCSTGRTTPWTPSKTPSWPAGKTCPACKRTGTLKPGWCAFC